MNLCFYLYAWWVATGISLMETRAQASDGQISDWPITEQISNIERQLGGRVGIAALDTASGRHLEYRSIERFPLCSTFKFLAAAVILKKVDEKHENLERRISYTAADLLEWAPVTREHLPEGFMTLEALCAAAIEYSDNTAGNLLLQTIGGPTRLTKYMRSFGDVVTRLDRTEPTLNSAIYGDQRDTSSPAAMLGNLRILLLGNVLSAGSRQKLEAWLVANTTGAKRLRSGFPPSWRVGDKTGTGENGAISDIAIAWPPKRAPILVAVYVADSTSPSATLNDAFAAVARLVAGAF